MKIEIEIADKTVEATLKELTKNTSKLSVAKKTDVPKRVFIYELEDGSETTDSDAKDIKMTKNKDGKDIKKKVKEGGEFKRETVEGETTTKTDGYLTWEECDSETKKVLSTAIGICMEDFKPETFKLKAETTYTIKRA